VGEAYRTEAEKKKETAAKYKGRCCVIRTGGPIVNYRLLRREELIRLRVRSNIIVDEKHRLHADDFIVMRMEDIFGVSSKQGRFWH